LLWKEPHPIFFAELDYRLHPTLATLENWSNIVQGTAENMADYPIQGCEHRHLLARFRHAAQRKLAMWSDTVFDLAYWRWGLNQAQVWRQRLGLARNPQWDQVLTNLAQLPVLNGVFSSRADTSTYTTQRTWEHPDPVGVYGMLPPIEGVDPNIAHSTVLKVWNTWDWNNAAGAGIFPGWPWLPRELVSHIAVDALLKNSSRN
jgi:hypothetical protein